MLKSNNPSQTKKVQIEVGKEMYTVDSNSILSAESLSKDANFLLMFKDDHKIKCVDLSQFKSMRFLNE